MAITIRSAGPTDAELLTMLSGFVHDLHLAARPGDFGPIVPTVLTAWFRTQMENPAVRIWIAEWNGRAVGYASATFVHRAATPFGPERRWVELDGIVVDPQYRRQGVARALIRAAVDQARAEGIAKLEATTWWFNDEARAAFARLGFTPKHVRIERTTEP